MKPSTRQAIANLLSALAIEFGASTPEPTAAQPEAAATPEPAKTKKTKAAAAAPAEPATPETPAEPAAEATTQEGKSYDDLRAIIEPFVKEGRGEEVKKIIAKYSAGGLKTMEAKHHASFEKDIAALGY